MIPMTSMTRGLLALVTLLMLADFVFRAVVPAFTSDRNDFSDPYVGAWLLHHGENPYDVALVNTTAKRLTHSALPVVPIYPPSAYVLVIPFSLLPWGWANQAWVLLSVIAVGITAWTLTRIGGFPATSDKAWLIVAFTLAFGPFHTAIHVANAAPIAIACCLLAVYLASPGRDTASGIHVCGCVRSQTPAWGMDLRFLPAASTMATRTHLFAGRCRPRRNGRRPNSSLSCRSSC